ncbi:MAG: leucine-rich repeat domain-containing protein [Prevotella sp.]|nr:leucine-rich repeat domain-containing protein [Prevotella sp.]
MRKLYGTIMGIVALCMPLGLSAAVSITSSGENGVKVHADSYGEFASATLTEAEKALIKNSSTLVLDGYFNSSDLQKFQGELATASTVDFKEAHLQNQTFSYWSNTLTTAITSDYATGTVSKQNLFANCDKLENITFNGSVDIANDFNHTYTYKSVTFGSKVKSLASGAFQNCTALATVTFEETATIAKIPSSCFQRTAIADIVIPSSVTEIESDAFGDITTLKTVTIPENSQLETIRSGAFRNNANLTDVYVNANKQITCEKDAFGYDATDGQTNINNLSKVAKLHYPSDYYDYYVGNWKSGFYNTQTALLEHRNNAQNGWQQFVASGIVFTDLINGRCFQTYSDVYAHEVPNNLKMAYIVTGYENETVQLKSIPVIPANTGVLLASKSAGVLFMPAITDANNQYNKIKYDQFGNDYSTSIGVYKNYLEPINGTLRINNVDMEGGQPAYRNFFLSKYSLSKNGAGATSDYYAFFRAYSNTYTTYNRAYLHFPASLYTNAEGGVAEFGDDNTFKAGISIVLPEDEDNSNTTAIDKISTTDEQQDNSYYTLQGAKVKAPTSKGIYIHNGKKVIVK